KTSHELRTALQAASGWTAVLERARGDADASAAALASLRRSIATQAAFIEELLTASRIIAGTMLLDARPLALDAVVDAAVSTVEAAMPAPRAPVVVRIEPAVPLVIGDRARLEQVVANLVGNALKFTPSDGRVLVRVERAPAAVR